jgi:hypothetical protein
MLNDRCEGDKKRPYANRWVGVLIVEFAAHGANLFDR